MPKPRPRPLTLESLEDRAVPAQFGNPWPEAGHLTLSFTPDGTDLGVGKSSLFSTLNATAPTATWQRDILRAFQTWAVNANVNVGVVADGGQPAGTPGPVQGDARFGDVRVAAAPLTSGDLAIAMPFDLTAGSRAGDLWLNSGVKFGPGGYDLSAVTLHEAGHALGIPGSTDPASAMFQTYTGPRSGLSKGDVAALQALYGARKPDAFDAAAGNDTAAKGSLIRLSDSGKTTTVDADLTTRSDIDFYRLKVENVGGGVTVRLRTAGLSLLTPRLTVLDPAGRLNNSVAAVDPGTGDLSVRFTATLSAMPVFYTVEVSGASGGVFDVGSYRLTVRPDAAPPDDRGGLVNPDNHTDDTPATATNLSKGTPSGGPRLTLNAQASLNGPTDVDYFRFRTPKTGTATAGPMTVMVWTTDASGVDPSVTVTDKRGAVVAATVLAHDGGGFAVQVPAAAADSDYFVAVRNDHPAWGPTVGNYTLGITVGGQATALETFATGKLAAGHTQELKTLKVAQGQLFHLVLSAGAGSADAALRMTVYDAAGNVALTRFTPAGDTVSADVFLGPGDYTVRIVGGTRTGQPLAPLAYVLRGLGITDPQGPQPASTLTNPAGGSTTPGPTFTWVPTGTYVFAGPVDPYSNPWWF
jgi:hypothetical protein